MRRFNLILLVIAVVFFVWILNEVGWAKLWQHLRQVDGYWPLLLLPLVFLMRRLPRHAPARPEPEVEALP